ncbi:MAG TPA: preprotein translocase subunit SecG [Candidatus Brocadiaceae bacterium]
MVKAEKAFKWGIVIIVIFGMLNAFYFLNLITALKVVLPILCVFMIGSILLQSGKGGGLAAIGGLGDQSAFGTKTSTFLTKVTYLIGAAFIVATVFLFKLSIPTSALNAIAKREAPHAQHTHEYPGHEGQHKEGYGPHQKGESKPSAVGMQTIAEEESNKASHSQSLGMNPVKGEKQASGKVPTEEQKETDKSSNQ